MCLHGRMKMEKRMGVYSRFCEEHSVLFCTDLASRGLDFNRAVDWVVQVIINTSKKYTLHFVKDL